MCELKVMRVVGISMAVFITIVGMGTEGFYAWKVYEVDHCESYNTTTDNNNTANNSLPFTYDFCLDDRNQSDVCYHDDLEVRSYVGLAEGIVATIAGVCFIIGFAVINLPLIWIWVVWALGITSYNAYCIYDYHATMSDCVDSTEFWDALPDLDYGHFFIMVLTCVCCYGLTLLIIIPLASVITHMVGPNSTSIGSYELQERKR